MTLRNRTDVLLLAGFCAFLFFYGLGNFGLIGADEPRYAQVAREMLARRDWITPVLGGRPWLEKPPLYYWQAMFAYSLFGVHDWSARLPSAFDATVMAAAIYLFFRRSSSAMISAIALDAALAVASCAGVVAYARAASTDMPLAATFTVAMLAWWVWKEGGRKIWLVAFYACLALATLAKGPVAPVLAALVLIGYAALSRDSVALRKSCWFPGIALFALIILPWYVAVQLRNPGFFREFILQHNFARFSTDLYHHREPFWYYLPVTLIALLPWTVFVVVAFAASIRRWLNSRNSLDPGTPVAQFGLFACCWLVIPALFFSISQSKLAGYILPAIPAGALLICDYLSERQGMNRKEAPSKWLVAMHALASSAPVVPALLLAYLIEQHHLPAGRPLWIAIIFALVLTAGILWTLASRGGMRMLRFVTLLPVLISVAAVLRIGATAIDQTLSARPLAQEVAAVEMQPMTLAVYGVPRELEYGLTFYRNQLTVRYEWGSVPVEQHLLIAPERWQPEVAQKTAGRRLTFLGHYDPQHVDYYWVSPAATAGPQNHP